MTATEDIEFAVDGQTLRGKLYMAEKPEKLAVLFIHGWTGKTNDEAARVVAENGYSAMTFSLSGHNNSDGKLEDQTIEKSLREALAAYDFLTNKLPDRTKICVVGNSYGGYLSILLSAERPVAGLSLRVAANYIDDDFSVQRMGRGSENPEVFKWRHLALDPDATKASRALHRFSGPVQVMEAELDDVVPHQSIQNYLEAIAGESKLEYHLMKGWSHSLGDDTSRNKQYQDLLLNWLNKQL